jgi:hypothetical protein
VIDLPIEGVYSVEEQRALVYEYLLAPYGAKAELLRSRGISDSRLRRWKKAVLADTLDHGLVPRAGGRLDMDETSAVARLLQENAALREQLVARDAAHEQRLAERDEELARQRRAVDALGKAIEVLHPSGDRKSSEPDSAAAPAHDPTLDQTPDQSEGQREGQSR